MAHNNSLDNSESGTDFSGISTLKYFDIEPKEKMSNKNLHSTGKKVLLKKSKISQENTCVVVWFSLKNVQCLKNCIFIKKRLQHRCFSVKIATFLRTDF